MTSSDVAPAAVRAAAPDLTRHRRAQILHAAVVVIAREGADRARLKDVAVEAEVSLGMVQHYFRTRDALMADAFETMMALSAHNWEALSRSAPDPLVHLFVGLRLQVYGAMPFPQRWGFWVELWSVARRDPSLARTAHAVYERWTQPFVAALVELERLGVVSTEESPEQLVIDLLALIDGLAVRTVVDPDALGVDAMYARLLAAASRSLGLDRDRAQEADARARGWLSRHALSAPFSPALLIDILED